MSGDCIFLCNWKKSNIYAVKVRCHLEHNLTYLKKTSIKCFNNIALFCKWKTKVQREEVLHPYYSGTAINMFQLLAIWLFHRLSLDSLCGHFWQCNSNTPSIQLCILNPDIREKSTYTSLRIITKNLAVIFSVTDKDHGYHRVGVAAFSFAVLLILLRNFHCSENSTKIKLVSFQCEQEWQNLAHSYYSDLIM